MNELHAMSEALKARLAGLVERAKQAAKDAEALLQRAQKIVDLREACEDLVTLKAPPIVELARVAADRSEQLAQTMNEQRADMDEARELALAGGEALARRWQDLGAAAGAQIDPWQQLNEEMRRLDEAARAELRRRIEKGEERWKPKGDERKAKDDVQRQDAG